MDRIILVTCVVFLVVNFYIDVVVSASYYDTTFDDKTEEEDEIKISPMWFSPRLGKRKRYLKEDNNKIPVELANILEAFEDSPVALISVNTNGKYSCKISESIGKNNARFIPRLGRNIEEVKENERLIQDTDNADNMAQRSPPFAPRLGRRFSPYSPRLGRES